MIRLFTKVWNNFKEYIVLVILVLASLIILSQNKSLQVQKVRAIAFGSFATITSLISDAFSVTDLKRENEELRKINTELMLQISKLRNYGIVNSELKDLLGFKDTINLPLIPATVISRSLSMTQNMITLNVGSKDSVLPGMPVINDRGFIGLVHSTSEDFSIARTLQNVDLKLTVMDERSRINGIMKWTGEELIVVNIPNTFDIKTGDRIVTSELSSIVPVPIPIGVVDEFRKNETGIFSYVRVKPFIDLISIENVFILADVKSKQKENLELNFYKRK
ncbi:cell shape-determining protein MreC precursor [bacterium BMS3Abin03]|nr:cell shape-determining protein MreC precursor [bacterium BMS3Abin03]